MTSPSDSNSGSNRIRMIPSSESRKQIQIPVYFFEIMISRSEGAQELLRSQQMKLGVKDGHLG